MTSTSVQHVVRDANGRIADVVGIDAEEFYGLLRSILEQKENWAPAIVGALAARDRAIEVAAEDALLNALIVDGVVTLDRLNSWLASRTAPLATDAPPSFSGGNS